MDPESTLAALPPGARTDLMVLRVEGAQIDIAADAIIVRSPDRPGYHWGNALYALTDETGIDRWDGAFRRAHPEATWRAIGLPLDAHAAGTWEAAGWEVDASRALVAGDPIEPTPVPFGYTVRPLDEDGWAQRFEQEMAENEVTGRYEPQVHAEFLRRQIGTRRRSVGRGVAQWFGAFDADGALGGSMGITAMGGVARYASVLTSPTHRRRGIARHLLAVASGWAVGAGAKEIVIVADEGSDAARLYEHAGFVPGPPEVAVYRYPVPAAVDEPS